MEGKTEDEVPTYRSRLEEWKRKDGMEQQRMEDKTHLQKKMRLKGEENVTKTAKETANRKKKLPNNSSNNTGQPTLRSFMELKKVEKSERAAFLTNCVAPTDAKDTILLGTMTIEAKNGTGNKNNTSKPGGNIMLNCKQ